MRCIYPRPFHGFFYCRADIQHGFQPNAYLICEQSSFRNFASCGPSSQTFFHFRPSPHALQNKLASVPTVHSQTLPAPHCNILLFRAPSPVPLQSAYMLPTAPAHIEMAGSSMDPDDNFFPLQCRSHTVRNNAVPRKISAADHIPALAVETAIPFIQKRLL